MVAAIDEALVERVVGNLVSNAIRYAIPGTPIVIAAKTEAKAVVVSVGNLGPSIPAERAAVIFEPFVRLDDDDSATAGMGLGLSFCRLVVEAHGGTIRVEEMPGGGAVFRFSVPSY